MLHGGKGVPLSCRTRTVAGVLELAVVAEHALAVPLELVADASLAPSGVCAGSRTAVSGHCEGRVTPPPECATYAEKLGRTNEPSEKCVPQQRAALLRGLLLRRRGGAAAATRVARAWRRRRWQRAAERGEALLLCLALRLKTHERLVAKNV